MHELESRSSQCHASSLAAQGHINLWVEVSWALMSRHCQFHLPITFFHPPERKEGGREDSARLFYRPRLYANLWSRARACLCVRVRLHVRRKDDGRRVPLSRGQVIFNIVDARSASTEKGEKSHRPFLIVRFVLRLARLNSTIF